MDPATPDEGAVSPIGYIGDPEDLEHDGWCTPPMNMEEGNAVEVQITPDWDAKLSESSDVLESSIDISKSSGRDPKDVYNLIPGEELAKCSENRRPSNGITPPPPSPMHATNVVTKSRSFRAPLKAKSSSVEGKTSTSLKSGAGNDGSGSPSPEPSDAALLHPSQSPSRGTPSPVASAPVLSTSGSSADLKKSGKKGEVDVAVTPPAESTAAFKRSDSRVSSGTSAGSSSVDKKSRKSAWYNRFNASYKTKSESFRRLFNLPSDERLLVDYSCALQRDILLQGRMYISQNYVCFYANIFRWETIVSVRCKDIKSVKRERTARVIPNAIQIVTDSEKYFFTSFATREKTYMMVFRVWQNALMDQPMTNQELWNLVHRAYGDELGLTSDDDDYVPPSAIDDIPSPNFDIRTPEGDQTSRILVSQQKDSVDMGDEDKERSSSEKHGKLKAITGSGDGVGKDQWSPESGSGVGWSPPGSVGGSSKSGGERKKLTRQAVSESTDESDTTKSDNEGAVTHEPVKCTEPHNGRVLMDAKLPLSVDQAFTFLFTSSEFILDFLASKKTYEIQLGEWEAGEKKGEKVRCTSYKVPVETPMGPRTSFVTQNQKMISCSKPGHLYSVYTDVYNSGIPYGESFYLTMHFCFKKISATECHIYLDAHLKYTKSVWKFIQGFIDKNTWVALEDYYLELKKALIDSGSENRSGLSRARGSTKSRLRLSKKPPGGGDGGRPGEEPTHFLRKGSTVTIGPGERSLELAPDADSSPIIARATDSGDADGSPSPSFLRIILIVLVSLLFCNAFLFTRLWSLEQSLLVEDSPAFSGVTFFPRDLRDLPEKPEDVMGFIREQERSHLEEVAQWQQVISSATELLKQVEGSLLSLQERLADHPVKMAAQTSERLRVLFSPEDSEVIIEEEEEDELR